MPQRVFDGFSPVHHSASQDSAAQSPSTFSEVLYTTGEIFNRTLPAEQETALSSALKSITEYLEAEAALVYLYDWDKKIFSVIGTWPQYHAQRHMPFEASLSVIPADLFSQLRSGETSLSSFHRNDVRSTLITVSDAGAGIPEDRIGSIFDRFRQDDPLTRAHEGYGIGLSLTKALTALLDGSIWVESRPGHGARFFVELPVLQPAVPSQRITQDGLSLLECVQIAFSEVRIK